MGIVIARAVSNLPGALYFTLAFFYKSLKQSSLCKARKKANQCFFFTRGCEACLEYKAEMVPDYSSMKEIDMVPDYYSMKSEQNPELMPKPPVEQHT